MRCSSSAGSPMVPWVVDSFILTKGVCIYLPLSLSHSHSFTLTTVCCSLILYLCSPLSEVVQLLHLTSAEIVFLRHQTAAGRTSPHSVSVYFSTIWSVHILVKLVSANTFPSQNEWVSVISAAPAFNIRYAAYLQRTRTDAMPPPGATASNTCRQINTNITAMYKHIGIDTHAHIFSQTRTDVTQHAEESNSFRKHLQTWTEAGIRAQRQNERNTMTDKNTRGQTRNGRKKWGWV